MALHGRTTKVHVAARRTGTLRWLRLIFAYPALVRNCQRLPEALTAGVAVSSNSSECRVEYDGERYGYPEVEEAVTEVWYHGLGTNPEPGEGWIEEHLGWSVEVGQASAQGAR